MRLAVADETLLHVRNFLLRRTSGLFQWMKNDRVLRRRRSLLTPSAVDEIARHGLELQSLWFELRLQPPDFPRRMQPWIEPNDGTVAQMCRQPFGELCARNTGKLEQGRITFLRRLNRIAPVDKKSGLPRGDGCEPCTTRETRKPAQPLR